MNWMAFVVVTLSVLLFYIIGTFVLSLFKIERQKDSFYTTFIRIILGIIISIFIFAIIKTRFNTILWGFVIIGLLYYFDPKKKSNSLSKEKITAYFMISNGTGIAVLFTLIFSSAFFLLQSGLFYNSPLNNLPHSDFFFYSSLIQNLNRYGVENSASVINPFTISYIASPYHYADLWLAALFSYFTPLLTLESYIVVTHSVLAGILCLGMVVIARKITNNKLVQVLSVGSVFFTGILLFHLPEQLRIIDVRSANCSLVSNPKYLFISLFFVWYFISALNEPNSKKQLYILMILPVINIAMAPVIFLSTSLFSLVQFIRKRNRENFYQGVIILILAIFIMLFYLLQNKSANGAFNSTEITSNTNIASSLKLFAKIIASFFMSNSIFWIPLFIALIFLPQKIGTIIKVNKQIFIYPALILFFGAIIWSFTKDIRESEQLFILPVLVINIFNFIVILFILDLVKFKWIRYLTILFLLFLESFSTYKILSNSSFYHYSPNRNSINYVNDIVNKINNSKDFNYKGANIRNPIELKGYWGSIPYYGVFTNYLVTDIDGLNTISLNTIYTPKDSSWKEQRILERVLENYPFSKFGNRYKNLSIDSIQFLYVKKNNLNYIVVSKNATLPKVFYPIVDTIFTDNKSGDKFVFLKRN